MSYIQKIANPSQNFCYFYSLNFHASGSTKSVGKQPTQLIIALLHIIVTDDRIWAILFWALYLSNFILSFVSYLNYLTGRILIQNEKKSALPFKLIFFKIKTDSDFLFCRHKVGPSSGLSNDWDPLVHSLGNLFYLFLSL